MPRTKRATSVSSRTKSTRPAATLRVPDVSSTLSAAFNLKTDKRRGNCYFISEALYHILGGKAAGWKPMRLKMEDPFELGTCTHWYLKHESGVVLDASRLQFRAAGWWLPPDYSTGRGAGFLTKKPSRRARRLMTILTWAFLPNGDSTC